MDDEKLIEAVQARPAIYDKHHKLHHRRDYVTKQWLTIAEEIGSDANACKTRWCHIRDYFLKKYRESMTASCQAGGRKIKWHLFGLLSFLVPVYCQRQTGSDITMMTMMSTTANTDYKESVEGVGHPCHEASSSSTCDLKLPQASGSCGDYEPFQKLPPLPPSRKRTRASSSSVLSQSDEDFEVSRREPHEFVDNNDDDDDDVLFVRSLVPSMKRLDYLQKMEFRLEVQSLLLKYLRQMEVGP